MELCRSLLLLSLNYQWRNRSKWTVWPSGSSYTSLLLVCPIWILKLLGLVVVALATCSFWPKLYSKSSHTPDTTVWCTQLFFALCHSWQFSFVSAEMAETFRSCPSTQKNRGSKDFVPYFGVYRPKFIFFIWNIRFQPVCPKHPEWFFPLRFLV